MFMISFNEESETYLHGYGKGLVKGMNVHLQNGYCDDGSPMTKLSFRVNRFYLSQIKPVIEISQSQLDAISPSSNSIPMNVRITGSTTYQIAEEPKVLLFATTDDKLLLHVKNFLNAYNDAKIKIAELGSIEMIGNNGSRVSNTVAICLKGTHTLETFIPFLTLLGLEAAATLSTAEDIEKMKLNFLFQFFHPKEAYLLQQDELFGALSDAELKAKMRALVPSFDQEIDNYPVRAVTIIPGYVRLSLPIAAQVHALGIRALTAEMSTKEKGEIATKKLSSTALRELKTVLKKGVLSERLSDTAAASCQTSISTKLIWKKEIDAQKKLEKFAGDGGDVRLYFSLKALNRGSCQYNRSLLDTPEVYKDRKNILEFIRHFPSWKKVAIDEHQVKIPDMIFPEEIVGISVLTESIKAQIITYLRKHGRIHKDANGHETINGIAIDEFISTAPHVPAHLNREDIL
jgi:hypothetical protein